MRHSARDTVQCAAQHTALSQRYIIYGQNDAVAMAFLATRARCLSFQATLITRVFVWLEDYTACNTTCLYLRQMVHTCGLYLLLARQINHGACPPKPGQVLHFQAENRSAHRASQAS